MAKVTIGVETGSRGTFFEFATTLGETPRVCQVLVMDRAITVECWQISTLTRDEASEEKKRLIEDRLRAARLSLPDGMHPLSDLLPPEPRYVIADQVARDVDTAASTALRSLVYGVLPEGFVQLLPDQGVAVPLESGRLYDVVVFGADFGSLSFTAR